MRKWTAFVVLALVVLLAQTAAAQETVPLEFDTLMTGTLTASVFERVYTFQGRAGDVVLVDMLPRPGTYDLDPALILRASDGTPLATSDNFDFPSALVVAELPADGTYNILATRSGGSTGVSTGDYVLRAQRVQPAGPGTSVEVMIYSDQQKDLPERVVFYPQTSGPMQITVAQELGDLYASLALSEWQTGNNYISMLRVDDTYRMTKAALTFEVEAGQFYVLTVRKALFSFVFGQDISAVIKISVQ